MTELISLFRVLSGVGLFVFTVMPEECVRSIFLSLLKVNIIKPEVK